MVSHIPLPEEDTLLYIQGLENYHLPLPSDEYGFLLNSSLKDTSFINTYGLMAARLAKHWRQRHPNSAISLSEVVEHANIVLLAAREQFIANSKNRRRSFSRYAAWFIKHELAKLS